MRRSLPLLVVLFAGSGCAALIYQVVWFQLLGLVIGASAVSLGVLLATFMGGMCLGSLGLPRFVAPHRHPLRVYALLELGIGVIGLLVLYAMPTLGGVYTAWAGASTAGLSLRALVAALCLLPPTILMGATLPAIARWVDATPRGVAWLGFFYAANIGGAVAGSLLAGFYLLRVYDVIIATFAAGALNLAVGGVSLALAGATRHAVGDARAEALPMAAASWPIYATIALSGATALAAEVIWTRHLSLLFGATVYAFAVILAVFLLGLGIGSGAGAMLARTVRARAALGYCQLLLCLAIAWAGYTVAESLPYWPLDVTLASRPAVILELDLVRAALAILPAAVLWGASFPLALAAAASRGRDAGRLVGRLYAANTIGAIVGALATSFVLVVWLGSQLAQQILILVCACSGLLVLAARGAEPRLRTAHVGAAAAILVAAVVVAYGVPELPRELVAYGRFMPLRGPGANVIYMGEGLTAAVAVSEEEDGIRTFHSAGKAQASTYPQDLRLQRMLGHLTTLVPGKPNSLLVIGLGAGVTAGAVSLDPAAERVVVAEIEPLVSYVAAEYFREHNFGVGGNPKVEIHIDDGRHYLATTEETFDGITSDPLDPWVRGAAALYTREFWQLVRGRLNRGGVVTVFVQLYESTEDAVKSELATFFEVFPNGAVFANTVQGMGYDAVLLGRADAAPIDVDRIQTRLDSPEYERVRQSLAQVGFRSAIDLLGTYAGRPTDLAQWLHGAAINTDRNLRLQYLAGEGLNIYEADSIFDDMTAQGLEFPSDLFAGSPESLAHLRGRILAQSSSF
jgi:spermidine synthase